jgi:inosose dehydratase
MKVGCFALVQPFSTLETQLAVLKEWGFSYADVTDNTDGACLGVEYGFTGLASLDANPFDLLRLFKKYGITITSFCAHANLLDPSAPWRYGTAQIIKAVRAAAAIGVKHVITAEGDPKTAFGHGLSEAEALFVIREKLHEPLRLAADLGVKILLEPHGRYTGSETYLQRILDAAESPALGVNLDTGNLWLGGGDSVSFIRKFGSRIEHVHWKDWPADMAPQRGKVFGAGMSAIPLGTGVVDIKGAYRALKEIGYDGYTTLEVAGEDSVKQSLAYLQSLGA